MLKHKTIHLVAAVIFALIALLHLLRLVYSIPVIFGTWQVPVWLSFIAVLVGGYLAIILWKSAKK